MSPTNQKDKLHGTHGGGEVVRGRRAGVFVPDLNVERGDGKSPGRPSDRCHQHRPVQARGLVSFHAIAGQTVRRTPQDINRGPPRTASSSHPAHILEVEIEVYGTKYVMLHNRRRKSKWCNLLPFAKADIGSSPLVAVSLTEVVHLLFHLHHPARACRDSTSITRICLLRRSEGLFMAQ